jgi:FtsP/CotA-like multicopper oxidase with cupredoxin domain
VKSVRIGVAERVDIIVDFASLPNNPSTLFLENRLEQKDGRAPTNDILRPGRGNKLVEFRIGAPLADNSVDPATAPELYSLPDKTAQPLVTRTFRFERQNGQWAVNKRFMNCDRRRFRVKRNSVEKWILQNNSGGWQHPIHIHLEEFQILRRNGTAPRQNSVDNSRKDVVRLGFNEKIELFFRFRDFRGDFPMHCHNTIHEDHAMMMLFEVDDVGDRNGEP